MGTGSLHLTYKISMVQTAVVSILDDARLFFSAQTDFAALQDNFDFLNPSNRHWSHSCKYSEKEPHDAWCNDADTYLKVGFLILYCILSWCDDGFQGSTFEFIWTKNCKKKLSQRNLHKEEKKVMKRKENKGQSRWKNDHFFRSFIWNCKKMFLLCRTKNGEKIKNGCQK